MDNKKIILRLIKLDEKIKKKCKQINEIFSGGFSLNDGMDDIILDLMGYPEERSGGDLKLSAEDVYDKYFSNEEDYFKNYGFCRDYYNEILYEDGMDVNKKYNLLEKELKLIKTKTCK